MPNYIMNRVTIVGGLEHQARREQYLRECETIWDVDVRKNGNELVCVFCSAWSPAFSVYWDLSVYPFDSFEVVYEDLLGNFHGKCSFPSSDSQLNDYYTRHDFHLRRV
jgi:hypothetical protein